MHLYQRISDKISSNIITSLSGTTVRRRTQVSPLKSRQLTMIVLQTIKCVNFKWLVFYNSSAITRKQNARRVLSSHSDDITDVIHLTHTIANTSVLPLYLCQVVLFFFFVHASSSILSYASISQQLFYLIEIVQCAYYQ